VPSWKLASAAALCITCGFAPASALAQAVHSMSDISTMMKSSAMPVVSSIGPGNAAGFLGYCVKNNYLSGSSANSVVTGLMKKPGVASSPGFAAGQAGQIVNGSASPVSIAQAPDKLKSQLCNKVLRKGIALR